MLGRILLVIMHYTPWLKRFLWRRLYEDLAKQGTGADWGFMNYGYAPLEGEEAPALTPDEEPHRYSIQLYNRVAKAANVAGKKVLEVGSGRGGGAAFVARRLGPESVVGVDYSANAVRLCNERHHEPGLSFVAGDAEALPFEAGSFDAVLNVESSHCYGSMKKFLAEVARVLRPGGRFSFADVRWHGHRRELHAQMLASGMTLVEHEDITPQVKASFQLDDERKKAFIANTVDKSTRPRLEAYSGVKGTDTYRSIHDGTLVYMRYLMEKPAVAV